jgi:hypothetical protein
MRTGYLWVSAVACMLLNACSGMELPKIDRHPAPDGWADRGPLGELPAYDPASTDPLQVDLRGWDLSALDLRSALADLQSADFDDRTIWPPAERMPPEFYWQRIMELGRNPGLGVRRLHEGGITGQGVGIAIIDQPLLAGHQEYAARLRLYEEIHVTAGTQAQMHGTAVASIAVGQTVGVAPGADLYYVGSWTGDFGLGDNGFTYNFAYYAKSVRRILEINVQLPPRRRIRVIALQVAWGPEQRGYDDLTAAVDEARAAGIFVVSSSLEATFGLRFNGLGRDPSADPDLFESYGPGSWWAGEFGVSEWLADRLLVPMDSRTTASPAGTGEYVFYRHGGWSWSIPYIAGIYALACQIDPAVTPDRFWQLAMQTGRTIQVVRDDQVHALGPILDPVALIAALQGK